jgi:hypothetical protein
MRFLPPAPQAGASANSATWASTKDNYRQKKVNCQFSFKRFEKQVVLIPFHMFLDSFPSLAGKPKNQLFYHFSFLKKAPTMRFLAQV